MPLVVLVARTASDRVGVLAAADGHDERALGQYVSADIAVHRVG